MALLIRLISVAAAAITSVFVARDALNFSFVETMITVVLIVAAALAAEMRMIAVAARNRALGCPRDQIAAS